jgi:hypothetical protein
VSCCRRHTALHGTRGRQALPAGGLLEASRSSSRQHALLAVSAGHTAAARRCGAPGRQPHRGEGGGGAQALGEATADYFRWTAVAHSHLESGPVPFMDHSCTTRSRCMPLFTSSGVAFPGSSAFTASCNDRRCTNAN